MTLRRPLPSSMSAGNFIRSSFVETNFGLDFDPSTINQLIFSVSVENASVLTSFLNATELRLNR
jgi:hypothetical protein